MPLAYALKKPVNDQWVVTITIVKKNAKRQDDKSPADGKYIGYAYPSQYRRKSRRNDREKQSEHAVIRNYQSILFDLISNINNYSLIN